MSVAKLLILVLVISTVVAASFCNVYYIRNDPGVRIVSKDGQAYLFLGEGHTGYHFSYLAYPLVVAEEFFYAPPLPKDQISALTEVKITSSGAEQEKILLPAHSPSTMFFTPFDDGFYAMCGMELCKLTSGGFRPATPAEEREIGGTEHLYRGNGRGETVNGWSMRDLSRSPGEQFSVNLGPVGIVEASSVSKAVGDYPKMSVNLVRPGQAPVVLYRVDGHPHRVSKGEYRHYFQRD